MHGFHNTLLEKSSLYSLWHNHPLSRTAHWLIFFAVAMVLASAGLAQVESSVLPAQVAEALTHSSLSQSLPQLPRLPFSKGELKEPSPDHILLKFKKSAVLWTRQDIYRRHGLTEKSEIKQIGVKIVNISPDDTPDEVVQRLLVRDKAAFEFVEVDTLVAPSLSPNDPYYVYNYQWHLNKISAPTTWDISTGAPTVVIAILDTGVDCNHPDLAALCTPGWNFYDNNANTSDVYGHGTAVAGVAAALTNNNIGVASTCWNCKIMPVRVSDINGYGNVSAIASGLTYSADHGARVANISYGVSASLTVASAAQYFQSKGGVVTVAAGNQTFFDSSADNPYVLTVSGTDSADTLASFSNTGNNIDLAAPGVSIITTGYNVSTASSNYVSGTGTSASAPIVAGVAALVMSVNPSLTPVKIHDIFKQSADDFGASGWDSEYGWGRINAYKAVSLACTYPGNVCGVYSGPDTAPPSSPQNLAATAPDSTAVFLSWSASTDDVGVVGYTIYRNDVEINNASSTTYVDRAIVPGSTYSYYIKAYDAVGNLSQISNVASVNVPSSLPTNDTSAPTVPSGLSAIDMDSTKVNLSWNASSDNVGVAGYNIYRNNIKVGTSVQALYVDSTVSSGAQYTYVVRAFDASGNLSQPSSGVTLIVPPPLDTMPPSAPTNLSAISPDYTKVNLSWTAATDNMGVAGYRIFKNGALQTSISSTAYTDTSVVSGVSYTYYVVAFDKVGNTSANSNTVTITVPNQVTTPAVSITSYQVSKKTATSALIMWTTSVPTLGSISFGPTSALGTVVSDPVTSTTHSITLTGLTKATKYYYKITATDGSTIATTPVSTWRTMSK